MPLKSIDVSPVVRSPEEVDQLFPWLRGDVLRAIPHFISPAWNTDRSRFDPVAYAKVWRKIGFDSVTLLTVHHDGYYLYPSELTKAQPDRDYFGEQVKACAAEGLRTIAYYSLSLNNLVANEHPDWRIRDLRDRVLIPDHRYFFHYSWLCINSPYRDFVIGQVREIAMRYPVSAIWLDILYLPPHPKDGFLTEEEDTCFCACCHRAYSDWYQGESLLDAWKSERHDEFRAESYRRFLFDLKSMLAKLDRPVALSFNGAGRRRCAFYGRVDELADWSSGEAHNKLMRNVSRDLLKGDGYPMELMSCSELIWSHNVSKPSHLVKLESLSTLLANGTYTLGVNHAPDGRLQPGNIQRLVDWGQWVRKHADSWREGEPVCEVGILEVGQPLLAMSAEFIRWVDFLTKGHFLFKIVRSEDPLTWPRCVIVTSGLGIDDDLAMALESYVRKGGRLLLEGPMARRHKDGRFFLGDLAGVEAEGTLSAHAFYLLPVADVASGLIAEEPIYFQCGTASVMTTKSATVLAELVPQFRDKVRLSDVQLAPNFPARKDEAIWHPGAVVHQTGKGMVLSTALTLSCPDHEKERHPWPRILAGNFVRYLLGNKQAVRIASHEAVEVVVRRSGSTWRLHLINRYYDSGEYVGGEGAGIGLHDIRIELDEELFGAIKLGPTDLQGNSLRFDTTGGFITLRIPRLELYDCVKFESDPVEIVHPSRRAEGRAMLSTAV